MQSRLRMRRQTLQKEAASSSAPTTAAAPLWLHQERLHRTPPPQQVLPRPPATARPPQPKPHSHPPLPPPCSLGSALAWATGRPEVRRRTAASQRQPGWAWFRRQACCRRQGATWELAMRHAPLRHFAPTRRAWQQPAQQQQWPGSHWAARAAASASRNGCGERALRGKTAWSGRGWSAGRRRHRWARRAGRRARRAWARPR
mmetsp:Transcript_28933/g.94201  ORF Transcript_28933/g.94201 Transcript_28933/m.94201 type:complete len:202 (+) Transcript_28933:1350-1955(+)